MTGPTATLRTTEGDIGVELHAARAPRTVANFVGLATGERAWIDYDTNEVIEDAPLYADLPFHRVEEGFIVQTGDPTGTGRRGPGYTVDDEFDGTLGHDGPGVVSMANRAPDANGSQFFITLDAQPHLDGTHTVFGRVREGMDVVRAIARAPTDRAGRPLRPVRLDSIEIRGRTDDLPVGARDPRERPGSRGTDRSGEVGARSTGTTAPVSDLDVVVSGGSMGGLFAGVALSRLGHEVDVYERSRGDLESRGSGIVLRPEMVESMDRLDIAAAEKVTVPARRRVYLDRRGDPVRTVPTEMRFTSWDAVYRTLRAAFPDARYHPGKRTVGTDRRPDGVTVRFADGTSASGDLFVVAEGGESDTRQRILPEVEPAYAGYVAYRGTVSERAAPSEVVAELSEQFTLCAGREFHALAYTIPGPDGQLEPGKRRLNLVWYHNYDRDGLARVLTDSEGRRRTRSVPPGRMSERTRREMNDLATELMPEAFEALVRAIPEPYVQSIYDLTSPRMAMDRIALVGDAAIVVRPHTAAGTSKAAADGVALADALDRAGTLAGALGAWEERRLREGRRLVRKGVRIGTQSQFNHPRRPPSERSG